MLSSKLGKDAAALVALSSREAIDACEDYVRKYDIQCGFARQPAFLFTEDPSEVPDLEEEAECMTLLGCDARWTADVPLPFPVAGGVLVAHQAQMDAYSYCLGLASAFTKAGGQIFESTRASGMQEGEPCLIETADGPSLRADTVIVAGHVPINNRVLLHTKLTAYRTYVFAAVIDAPLGGMFFDTEQPYHYLRTHTIGKTTYLIAGGEDHRTGIEDESAVAFPKLEEYLKTHFAVASRITHRWSGQIIEPVDGLPYIGRNSFQSRTYVATGYAGNGITFGTLAGMILRDLILDRPNRFSSLYDATRLPSSLHDIGTFVRENAPFPAALVRDRLTRAHVESGPASAVARGEGKVLRINGTTAAVSRDEHGKLQAVSAVCSHLGCDVHWNNAEKTWDCPCHGSRFSRDGRVLSGPATTNLAPVNLA